MTSVFSESIFSHLLKSGSILLLGTGIGMLANIYSPVFVTVGTAFFTFLCISLYIKATFVRDVRATALSSEQEQNRFLLYLFYLAFFLSITIPKSGRTISNIPITTANIVILCALLVWAVRLIFVQENLFSLPLAKPLLVFMLYGCVSIFIGLAQGNPYKIVLLDFVAFIGFIPVYFLVCSVLRTPSGVQKVIWLIVISLLLVCSYGMLQKRIGFDRIAVPGITEQYNLIIYQGVGRWNVIEGGGQKLYSTFQNGNIFGNHLATFIPFLAGIVLGAQQSRKKFVLFIILLFTWYILFLTYSRGALVGMVGGFMALAVISKKIRVKAILVIMLVVLILGAVLWQYAERPEMVRYDLRRISTDPNRFSAGRLERAQQVLSGVAALPLPQKLFGLGFGGELITSTHWRFMYVDNLYLTLLFKMGIIGIVILFITLFQIFVTLLKYARTLQDIPSRSLIYGGIAGLTASLIHNLADTLWFFPPLAVNFWFLTGITVCIGTIGIRQQEAGKYQRIVA